MADPITARVAKLRAIVNGDDPDSNPFRDLGQMAGALPWALDTIERLQEENEALSQGIEIMQPDKCMEEQARLLDTIESLQVRASRLETMLRRNGSDQGCEFSEDLRVLHYWSTDWIHGEDVAKLQARVQELEAELAEYRREEAADRSKHGRGCPVWRWTTGKRPACTCQLAPYCEEVRANA